MSKSQNTFEMQYKNKGFSSQRRYPNESFVAFLGSHFFHLPPQNRAKLAVLELGCGSGANLWVAAKEGFQSFGIDFSPTGLALCREMLDKWAVQAELRLADMTELPYDPESFDVIFDIVSSQHLTFDQHRKMWAETLRCLKSGGLFYSYHLGENSISLKSTNQMLDHCTVSNIAEGYPLSNNGPTCFLSANEVRKELNLLGFKDVLIEKIYRSYSNQTVYLEYLSITAKKMTSIR